MVLPLISSRVRPIQPLTERAMLPRNRRVEDSRRGKRKLEIGPDRIPLVIRKASARRVESTPDLRPSALVLRLLAGVYRRVGKDRNDVRCRCVEDAPAKPRLVIEIQVHLKS